MDLHLIDIAIIVVYLLSTVAVGYWVSHRASRDMKAYFLGGNTMPWYILGISNASGMFDISGTMLLVYWMFVYGLKSVWIPWLWPTFNQIFLMVYLSAWLRRSNAMTGAEWIETRFGKGRGAQLAHVDRRALATQHGDAGVRTEVKDFHWKTKTSNNQRPKLNDGGHETR